MKIGGWRGKCKRACATKYSPLWRPPQKTTARMKAILDLPHDTIFQIWIQFPWTNVSLDRCDKVQIHRKVFTYNSLLSPSWLRVYWRLVCVSGVWSCVCVVPYRSCVLRPYYGIIATVRILWQVLYVQYHTYRYCTVPYFFNTPPVLYNIPTVQ